MNEYLVPAIESALRTVRHFSDAGFQPARSVEDQLFWCWRRATGEILESPPVPLTMSVLVEQDFDSFGAYPLLAHLLGNIELQMEQFDMKSQEYTALSA